MTDKTPSQLIEERIQEMGPDMYHDSERMYMYTCMDTGMKFETYGQSATYSPYTGSMNIMAMNEDVNPSEYMKPSSVPPSQSNMHQQTPLHPNPVPAGSAPKGGPDYDWMNKPWAGNPAPDAQGVIGADASSVALRGFVPYPQQSVPPHVNKNPGEKT